MNNQINILEHIFRLIHVENNIPIEEEDINPIKKRHQMSLKNH